MLGAFASRDLSKLPISLRVIVDCANGPQALIAPPGYLLVQDALDSAIIVGVRRAFTPKSCGTCADDLALAMSSQFVFKSELLAAMGCKQ